MCALFFKIKFECTQSALETKNEIFIIGKYYYKMDISLSLSLFSFPERTPTKLGRYLFCEIQC